MAALYGHVTPDPVVVEWGTEVTWPGPRGAAVVGVRRSEPADADNVLAALQSRTPTIVLGVPSSERAVVDLLRAGAKAVLARDCSPSELVRAMQKIRRELSPMVRDAPGCATDPTPRELEVTTLLAQGLTNREIAGALFISEHTVRNHLGHVFAKLGVTSRTQAVMRAGQLGWLRLPV